MRTRPIMMCVLLPPLRRNKPMVLVRSSISSRHFAAPSSSVLTAPPGLHKNWPSQQPTSVSCKSVRDSHWMNIGWRWVNSGQKPRHTDRLIGTCGSPAYIGKRASHPSPCPHFVQRAKSDALPSLSADICHPNVKSRLSSARFLLLKSAECALYEWQAESPHVSLNHPGMAMGPFSGASILYLLRCKGLSPTLVSSRIFSAPPRHLFCFLA